VGLHRRAGLACGAGLDAVLGRFRVWEEAGLLAVLATDPALGFLSTVSGVATGMVSSGSAKSSIGRRRGPTRLA
jgi:hypothetical protein